MRDVEDLTDKIATRRHNRAFSISPSRLHDIETKGMTPNIYRLYALSIAYDYDLRKLLAFYGLP